MKVWIVDQNANLTYYAYSLALGLAENGCEVAIVTRADYQWVNESHEHKKISILESFLPISMRLIKRFSFFQRFQFLRMLIKSIEYPFGYISFFINYLKNQPDVIHFQYANIPIVELVVFKILRLKKKCFLYTAHNLVPHRKITANDFFYPLVYQQISHFIVHSHKNKEDFHQFYKIPLESIEVIPHGNYNAYIDNEETTQQEARQELGLSPDRKIVLFFGIIFKFKGLEYLISAMNRVRVDPDPLLLIVGKPIEGFGDYDRKIKALGLDNMIRKCLEYVSNHELSLYFKAADIVALPYTRTTQSGVILTAFSFGKPVIATSVGSFPETVIQGETGYLVPPCDEESLGQAITDILNDGEKLKEMGCAAKRHSDEVYDWVHIGKKTMKLYQKILEDKNRQF